MFASLATSLTAAFLAVLGKQWLNRYMNRKGGSAVERCHDRQRKFKGMQTWCFAYMMECLPLMMQMSLLLFDCAISRYLWTVNYILAVVNISFTVLGAVAYAFMILVASMSYACPYQTPASIILRFLVRNRRKYISKAMNLVSHMWQSVLSCPGQPCQAEDLEKGATPGNDQPSEVKEEVGSLFRAEQKELLDHEMDAACISWILNNSTEREVLHSTIPWINEIEWHAGANPVPSIDRLYHLVVECFYSSGELLPGTREQAYATLKTLIHSYIHNCIRGESVYMIHDLFEKIRSPSPANPLTTSSAPLLIYSTAMHRSEIGLQTTRSPCLKRIGSPCSEYWTSRTSPSCHHISHGCAMFLCMMSGIAISTIWHIPMICSNSWNTVCHGDYQYPGLPSRTVCSWLLWFLGQS